MKTRLFRSIGVILFLLIFPLKAIGVYDGAPFGIYGIEFCNTNEEYQKYIGQTVIYLTPNRPSWLDENFRKVCKGKFNTPYIISKIKKSDDRIILILVEKGGRKKVKMIINAMYGFPDFRISSSKTVPLLLIDKFEADKKNIVGEIFTSKKVKASYEVIDVVMREADSLYRRRDLGVEYPTLHYVVKNSITGEISSYPAKKAKNACFNDDLKGEYRSFLTKVEVLPSDSGESGIISAIEDSGNTKYNYVDSFINTVITFSGKRFEFKITNNTQNSIKILWNDAVFINYEGNVGKIMHAGVPYITRGGDMPNTTIIKGRSIEDSAVPVHKVYYDDFLKEWDEYSSYPLNNGLDPGQLSLMLPIQIENVVYEYVFVFDVKYIYEHPERLTI